MKKTFGVMLVMCVLLSCCAIETSAILDAATIFTDGKRAVEQPITDTPATPYPQVAVTPSPTRTPALSGTFFTSGISNSGGLTANSGAVQYTPQPQTQSQPETSVTISLQFVEDSSIISAAGYDENFMIMAIQLRATGEICCYRPVPKILYTKFMESAVKDSYFSSQIENRYERIQ